MKLSSEESVKGLNEYFIQEDKWMANSFIFLLHFYVEMLNFNS